MPAESTQRPANETNEATEATAATGTPPPVGEVPLPVRVQMMATEHWSLLASRNLAWTESFTRASMFLSTLSFAVVALALVGQASGFGEEFRIFALVVLPVVLFLGIATSLRMDSANHHDVQCIVGMNRIRAGYLELAPDLERFFVMGSTDDIEGIVKTMSVFPRRSIVLNLVSANPTLLAVLNSVLLGAIFGLGGLQVGAGMGIALIAGAIGFLAMLVGWVLLARHMLTGIQHDYQPMFPGAGRAPSAGELRRDQP